MVEYILTIENPNLGKLFIIQLIKYLRGNYRIIVTDGLCFLVSKSTGWCSQLAEERTAVTFSMRRAHYCLKSVLQEGAEIKKLRFCGI